MTRRFIFQDAETKSLAEVLSSVGEDKKAMILSGFKDAVVPILQKSVVSHTIIHKILFDFFTLCDDLAMKMVSESENKSYLRIDT